MAACGSSRVVGRFLALGQYVARPREREQRTSSRLLRVCVWRLRWYCCACLHLYASGRSPTKTSISGGSGDQSRDLSTRHNRCCRHSALADLPGTSSSSTGVFACSRYVLAGWLARRGAEIAGLRPRREGRGLPSDGERRISNRRHRDLLCSIPVVAGGSGAWLIRPSHERLVSRNARIIDRNVVNVKALPLWVFVEALGLCVISAPEGASRFVLVPVSFSNALRRPCGFAGA